jgi:acyl-homoserine lactone acylase PvdQ
VVSRFVDGINARVDQLGEQPPPEFTLAGLKPEHWAPEDPLPRGAPVDKALVRAASVHALVEGLRRPSVENLHQASFSHHLAVDDVGKAHLGPGSRPGYGYTVKMTGGDAFSQTDGATFREVLDLSDWDNSVATSAPGQSGQPESPHFAEEGERGRGSSANPRPWRPVSFR